LKGEQTVEELTQTTQAAPRQDPPFAVATLHRGRQCNQWVVTRCPLCGGKHYHGAGAPGIAWATAPGERARRTAS